VQVVQGVVRSFCPERSLPDATGRAENDSCSISLEALDNRGGILAICVADAILKSPVLMIVHAVASRRDRWLESQAIVRHPRQKTGGLLSAPTVLPNGDTQLRHTDGHVILHYS